MKLTLFIIGLFGNIRYSASRFETCLGNICEKYNDISGSSFAFSCEPRNSDVNLAALGQLGVDPPHATCGDPKMQFCGLKNPLSCMTCDNRRDDQRHPLENMVDDIKWTWWQSKLWPGRPNFRYEVNVTLSLPKTFLITDDIVVEFHDGKPQRMIIEKSNDYGKSWHPLQYYAEDCQARFGMNAFDIDNPNTHQLKHLMTPICSQKFSVNYRWQNNDVVTVYMLSKLQYLQRKGYNQSAICSAIDDDTEKLRTFLTITNLRIRLIRPPMVQPETGLSPDFERSQHYGIKKILMKGRCFCNGHASECHVNLKTKIVQCQCKHFTTGKDCERCQSLYWMKPWNRGTYSENKQSLSTANECTSYFPDLFNDRWVKQMNNLRPQSINTTSAATLWQPRIRHRQTSGPLTCKCNGHSQRCENTETLIGVLCVDCRHNTAGKHCDKCKNGFYKDKSKAPDDRGLCPACQCSKLGSKGRWCQPVGQCHCRPHFVGRTCNQCKTGYKLRKNICVPAVSNCVTVTRPCDEVMTNTSTNCVVLNNRLCSCVDYQNCVRTPRVQASRETNGATSTNLLFTIYIMSLVITGYIH